MKKAVIVHTLPIDYYPPAVNLVNILADTASVSVISTVGAIGNQIIRNDKVDIFYGYKEKRNGSALLNLIRNIWFVLYSLYHLIRIKPQIIIYFESISAASVYLYKRYINPDVKVCVHYHEYMTPDEYNRPGMRIWNRFRQLEKKWLLRRCHTISHTNNDRLTFFKKDYPFIEERQCIILPNYPPGNWKVDYKSVISTKVIKCVYIGSLSIVDMYLDEFIQWVNSQNGAVTVDFYSYNYHKEVIEYFNSMSSPWIFLHKDGIGYFNIPQLLSRYDVGLLLYKAKTINYQYNETNKLYEYLITGLGVIYPQSLILVDKIAHEAQFKDRMFSFNPASGEWPQLSLLQKEIDNTHFNCICDTVYLGYWERISSDI